MSQLLCHAQPANGPTPHRRNNAARRVIDELAAWRGLHQRTARCEHDQLGGLATVTALPPVVDVDTWQRLDALRAREKAATWEIDVIAAAPVTADGQGARLHPGGEQGPIRLADVSAASHS